MIPVILKLLNGMIGLEQTENNGNHKMGSLYNNRVYQNQSSNDISLSQSFEKVSEKVLV